MWKNIYIQLSFIILALVSCLRHYYTQNLYTEMKEQSISQNIRFHDLELHSSTQRSVNANFVGQQLSQRPSCIWKLGHRCFHPAKRKQILNSKQTWKEMEKKLVSCTFPTTISSYVKLHVLGSLRSFNSKGHGTHLWIL